MSCKIIKVLTSILLFVMPLTIEAKVVYVNGSYTGAIEDGTSWATPYKNLKIALISADANDEIWVAKGTYYPNTNNGLAVTKNVALYGGFEGNETSIYQRDWQNNKTILYDSYDMFAVDLNVLFSIDGFQVSSFDYFIYVSNINSIEGKLNITVNNCKFNNGNNFIDSRYPGNISISNSSITDMRGSTLLEPTDINVNNNVITFSNVKIQNAGSFSIRSDSTYFLNCEFNEYLRVKLTAFKNATFEKCTFSNFNNSSQECMSLSSNFPNANVIFNDCVVSNNTVGGGYSLFDVSGESTFLTIVNSKFLNNNGKMIYLACNLLISNCEFEKNINFNIYIFPYDSNVEIKKSKFLTNSGGLVYLGSSSPPYNLYNINLKISDTEFKNNNGTCLSYTHTGTSSVDIENCQFKNNIAGVLYFNEGNQNSKGKTTINNSIFENNAGGGSGVINSNLILDLNKCFFTKNSSTTNIHSSVLSSSADASFNNCNFDSNTAYSGSIGLIGGTGTFNNCLFKNNTRTGAGGAAAINSISKITVNNSLFYGNKNLYHDAGAPDSVLKFSAGAITSGNAESEISNCTFYNNSFPLQRIDNGEAISGAYKSISNCIFWNNGLKSPLPKYGIGKVSYSNVQGGYAGEGNMDTIPMFANADGGDFRLSCTSPLINKGRNSLAPSGTDLDGNTRTVAGIVDMGAYEFPYDPASVKAPPKPVFSVPTSACLAQAINFTNLTGSPENISFEWNFGDSATSKLPNPTHKYNKTGDYTITLKASNACGFTAQTTQTISVKPAFATSISYPTLVCPGNTSTFSANASCSNMAWTVEGGILLSGNGTRTIKVLWGDGRQGNGKITLNATGCGAGFCEMPISVEIPIVPVNFELSGPVNICEGTKAKYGTKIKNSTPSTLYLWSVKGGSITGENSGYNLQEIEVEWDKTNASHLGSVSLTTYNELLECGNTDSLRVNVRRDFFISGKQNNCTLASDTFHLSDSLRQGTFIWSISGSSNTIDPVTGKAKWGTAPGNYLVSLQTTDTNACKQADTLDVEVFGKPVLSGITGATEVDTVHVETYTAITDVADPVLHWQVAGGSLASSFGKTANVSWNNASSYKIALTAAQQSDHGGCVSDTFTIYPKKVFAYAISGPDTACIGTTGNFSVNTDSLTSATYTWTSSLQKANASSNNYAVTLDQPDQQTVSLTVLRNGKAYSYNKNVFVKASPSDLSIGGVTRISPLGGGSYKYLVTNSKNIQYTYALTGAASSTKNGNELNIVWGPSEPYSIAVTGTIPGSCNTLPSVITVQKAPPLSNQINGVGKVCLSARSSYTFETDEYTSKLSWTLSGGGSFIGTSGNQSTIEWNKTGTYTLTLQYERFGTQTSTLNINVGALPTPEISEGLICGNEPLKLSTKISYENYHWFHEPDKTEFSNVATPQVTAEGMYRVQVTDGHRCSAFTSKYIKQIPLPQVKILTENLLVTCMTAGKSTDVSMNTLEGMDYKYQWTMNGNSIAGATTSSYRFTQSLDNIASNTYNVKVTLNGCEKSGEDIGVRVVDCGGNTGGGNGGGGGGNTGGGTCNEPQVSFTTSFNPANQTFSFANTSTVSSNEVYTWDFGDGTASTLKNPPLKKYNVIGNYTVLLTRRCNSYSHKIEIPAVALFKLDAPNCKGQSIGFKDLSVNIPGSPIESWTWDFGDGATSTGAIAGGVSRDVSHTFATAGTYIVSLSISSKNSAGEPFLHSYKDTIAISAPPDVNFSVTSPSCSDNTYGFRDASSFEYSKAAYLWNFGVGLSSSLQNPSQQLSPGSKTVSLTITDLLGCTNSKSQTINVPVPVVASDIQWTGDTLLCNGKTTLLTAPAASSYVWKNGIQTVGTSSTLTVSTEGMYTLTYTSGNCTVTTHPLHISVYKVQNIITTSKAACIGDSILINTNLNESLYSFTWQQDGTLLSSKGARLLVDHAQAGNSGNYQVAVTDIQNGCSVKLPAIPISVNAKPEKPIISASSKLVCYNGSVTLSISEGKPGTSYSWYAEGKQLAGSNASLILNNILQAANYSGIVTDNVTGCASSSEKIFVDTYPAFSIVISGPIEACEFSQVSLSTNLNASNYDFQWFRNNVPYGPNLPKLSLASSALADSGSYYLTATTNGTNNLAGCKATSSPLHLSIKTAPVKPVISGALSICTGNKTILSTSLSDNFSWNTGETGRSIEVTKGGEFALTSVNPASGCEITTYATVYENPLPDLSFFPAGVYERCSNEKIFFQGLEAYLKHAWYVDGKLFSNSNGIYPSQSGNYSLSVTTDSGCVAKSDTIRLTVKDCPCYVTSVIDSGNGSLREAIICANSKPGKDIIKFLIDGSGPFTIQPLTALPVITDSVFIDGFSQSGDSIYDIVLDGSLYDKNALVLNFNLGNCKISGLSFKNFHNAISLSSYVHHSTIERNQISNISGNALELQTGTHHNLISNNDIQSSVYGINLIGSSSSNTLQKNLLHYNTNPIAVLNGSNNNLLYNNEILNSSENGIYLYKTSSSNIVRANTIGRSGKEGIFIGNGCKFTLVDSNTVGVKTDGTSIVNSGDGIYLGANCDSTVVRANVIGYSRLNGILCASRYNVFEHNFIGLSKSGKAVTNLGCGIQVSIDSCILTLRDNFIANNILNGIIGTSNIFLLRNTLINNRRGGIYVSGNKNKISKNILSNTVSKTKSIDLHFALLPAGNVGKLPAAFTRYRRSETGLLLRGTSLPLDTIELFVSNNVPEQALKFAGSGQADKDGNWEIEISEASGNFKPQSKNYYVNTTTDALGNTSELSAPFMTGCFDCICNVTSTANSGPGSLRAEVDSANAGNCLTINFKIATPDTILLLSPLSGIRMPVTINGTPGEKAPVIFVKGNSTFGGFNFLTDGADINHLGLTGFSNALNIQGSYNASANLYILQTKQPVKIGGNYNNITGSGINRYLSDTAGNKKYTGDTLIYITGSGNQIGAQNAGNSIAGGAKSGILVSGGKDNTIVYNSIYDNTIGIGQANNGNDLHPAPDSMISYSTPSGFTIIGTARPYDNIQMFTSSYVPEQAFTFVTEIKANNKGKWSIIVPAGLTNQNVNSYFIATATDTLGNTSPFSKPVRVGNKKEVCYVKNTLNSGNGSLRDAVDCANAAGNGLSGIAARIVFQLPNTQNEILISSGYSITNNYGVKINPYQIPVTIKAQSANFSAFTWKSNGLEIKNLTFQNFKIALNCAGASAVMDSNQFIGNTTGITINGTIGQSGQTISNNYFAGGTSAINARNAALTLTGNTLGAKKDGSDAAIKGYGISIQNCPKLIMKDNFIKNIVPGTDPSIPTLINGVPLYFSSVTGTIENNNISGRPADNRFAIKVDKLHSSSVQNNMISGSQIGIQFTNCDSIQCTRNQFNNMSATGLELVASDQVLMSENTISGLEEGSQPIKLHLASVNTSNLSKKTPTLLAATYHDNALHLIGQAEKYDKVELFYSDTAQRDLDSFIASSIADSSGGWDMALFIPAEQAAKLYFRATATSQDNRTSEASAAFHPDLRICLVTNNSDSEDGSMRDALQKANKNTCNLIQFDIPQSGKVAIEPASALPTITASKLTIDATSQPGYSKGNPLIEIRSNTPRSFSFNVHGSDQFYLYGISVNGHDTAVSISEVKVIDLQDNYFSGFKKTGISISNQALTHGFLINNKLTAPESDYGIYLSNISNIKVEQDSITGAGVCGIYAKAFGIAIANNNILCSNNISAIGIQVENGSHTSMAQNKISNAFQGISLTGGNDHKLFQNAIGVEDSSGIKNNSLVRETGIYVGSAAGSSLSNNTVKGSVNGIKITNSSKPSLSNNSIFNATHAIHMQNCATPSITGNTLDSVQTGIYLSASNKAMLNGNTISSIKDYGIYLAAGTDSSLFQSNVIGAEYLLSKKFSEGEGVHLMSSNNVIGGNQDENLANYIFHNKKGGIVIDGGIQNKITYNVLFENDKSPARPTALAIALQNGGNNAKKKPDFLDHTWKNGKLHLYGKSASANDSVHVYLGNGGYEEARKFMGWGVADNTGNWEAVIDTTDKIKPKTTLYLSATLTDVRNNTSPLSDMYIIGDCYITSLADTNDNEFPMPNSLRMAVKCANAQKNHLGIYFKVDKIGDKYVALQMPLTPLKNPYGISFNGRNLIADKLLAGIDGSGLSDTLHSSWIISAEQGPSTFDSLLVKNFSSAIQIMSDSALINGLTFSNIRDSALIAGNGSNKLVIQHSNFSNSESAAGICILPGAKNISIQSCTFQNLRTGIAANLNDSIIISNNTFFTEKASINSAVLVSQNTHTNILKNTFQCKNADSVIRIAQSKYFAVADNNFTDTSGTYLSIQHSSEGNISSNEFLQPVANSISIQTSDKINIVGNAMAHAPEDAIDLKQSEKIFISRNTITDLAYNIAAKDSALCINIHKKDTELKANHGKEEPVNLSYALKIQNKRKSLFVQGLASPGDSVEVFFSDSASASMNSFVVSAYTDSLGIWEGQIPRQFYHKDTTTWYHCIAVAIGPDSNTSQTSSVLHIPPAFDEYYVLNTNDSGANSLRDALLQVNASDLFSKVIFHIRDDKYQPGPYNIKLKSPLLPVYSYMGYVKDGNTQLGSGLGADQRIIIRGDSSSKAFGLVITDSSEACQIRNLYFNNTHKGMSIENNRNRLENIYFTASDSIAKEDTALVVSGSNNTFKNVSVSNHHAGIIFTKGATENDFSGSAIKLTDIGISVTGNSSKNIIHENTLQTLRTAMIADSAGRDNSFISNTIGGKNKAATGNGFVVNNSSSQTFSGNYIPFLDPDITEHVSSAFLITGNSSQNNFFENQIGQDKNDSSVHRSMIRGFTIIPSADGFPASNSIVRNKISGTGWAAIYANSIKNGLISANIIGADSLKSKELGIDSVGILLNQCSHLEISDNIIRGYLTYGIDLVKSDFISMKRNVANSHRSVNKGINIHIGTEEESNGGLVAPVILEGILIDTQTVRLTGTAVRGTDVEVFSGVKDTIQATAYITKVIAKSDSNGSWSADIPRQFFLFAAENSFVAQNHQGQRSSEYSNSFRPMPLLCQLASSTPPIKILEDAYHPCPGPGFLLDVGLDDKLTYEWTADNWKDTLRTKSISIVDSAINLSVTVKDAFGCNLVRHTEVLPKARPGNPDFILSSEVYANDTIQMIDISLPKPTEYTWNSSEGVNVVRTGEKDTLVGEDGNIYPQGRFIQFLLPDTGTFSITQKSLRDGCFVTLEKKLHAGAKNPNDKNPYLADPGIISLSAYPNPSTGEGILAHITLLDKDPVLLELSNVQGQQMITPQELSGKLSYDFKLPKIVYAGVYLLKLSGAGGHDVVFKIVVK